VFTVGEKTAILLTVHNNGTLTWRRDELFRLAYHWLDERGQVVVRDGLRTELPRDAAPGESIVVCASVVAPTRPGRNELRWDMVHEKHAWFSDRNPENALRKTVAERRRIHLLHGGTGRWRSAHPTPSADVHDRSLDAGHRVLDRDRTSRFHAASQEAGAFKLLVMFASPLPRLSMLMSADLAYAAFIALTAVLLRVWQTHAVDLPSILATGIAAGWLVSSKSTGLFSLVLLCGVALRKAVIVAFARRFGGAVRAPRALPAHHAGAADAWKRLQTATIFRGQPLRSSDRVVR
jgi:hypothetical protein